MTNQSKSRNFILLGVGFRTFLTKFQRLGKCFILSYTVKQGFLGLVPVMALCLLIVSPVYSATYYVRVDGGTATQCTGLADAPYPGSGTNLACALNHPFWAIAPIGNNPTKMVSGDTLIIDGTNAAQYKIGLGAPNTTDTSKCGPSWPWDCVMRKIPSGLDPTTPTKILGKGWNTGCANPPQLWGTERAWQVLDLRGSSNVELQCLEITDHSDCQSGGPNPCNRNTSPFGAWATTGIEAADSTNVLIKNVNIHGMAHKGIRAGRLKDWTLEDTKIVANSFVGWDGDIGANVSSNSGTMDFNRVTIAYNGCGETYPNKQPYNCYSQDQGGYGDGLGTHKTSGNWVFNNCDISHNVSDGLDLLYHDGTGTVTIKRSRFEGNAGNQAKTATTTTIENSLIIGNCAYFKNNPMTWQPSTFNNCRAFGNTVALSFRANMSATISDSTIITNGDNLILTMGDGCNGTEVLESRNNIFLGGPDYTGGDISNLYYASGSTGNGDGTCGTLKLNDDYSVIYGTRTIASDCSGKAHSKCQDPKLVEPLVSYYTGNAFNANLQSTSPAVNNALVLTGKSSLDYYNNDRGEVWDIGAVEYGISTSQLQLTCKDGIQYCLTQTDCVNNGYYWYNNICNAQSKTLTCVDGIQYCLTQTDCVNNGHYWYNNVCNAQPKPLTCADSIQYCLTQTDCVNNGYYWYNNTCNTQSQTLTCGDGICSSTESCSTCSADCGTCVCTPTWCDAVLPVCGQTTTGIDSCGNPCTKPSAQWPVTCIQPACGDGIIKGTEVCDGNIQTCTTTSGYAGTQSCNSQCSGFGTCTSSLFCGDGIKNGTEVCDGNTQSCTTTSGYAGTQGCNTQCSGLATCTSKLFCGDNICTAGPETSSNCAQDCSTTFKVTLEAESMPTKTTGVAVTSGWNIYNNGYIENTVQFPTAGVYRFNIVARGKSASGVWPNMQLRIDGSSKSNITVNTTSWATYTVSVKVTQGSHKIAIAFTNDYRNSTEDRNLYVDKSIITK